eukprot:TRINITY_DN1575_c0_g2_i1.p1 TRINITY_DN1575_c0_g2~~TRINITY_DN1575_c0_g2_i1.p1  ORF type:complete len:168 (+),score=26.06 TRINITY_DN1575_c0_g2_i1:77-580(+)
MSSPSPRIPCRESGDEEESVPDVHDISHEVNPVVKHLSEKSRRLERENMEQSRQIEELKSELVFSQRESEYWKQLATAFSGEDVVAVQNQKIQQLTAKLKEKKARIANMRHLLQMHLNLRQPVSDLNLLQAIQGSISPSPSPARDYGPPTFIRRTENSKPSPGRNVE